MIPWSSRDALLERLLKLESIDDVSDVFRAVGTTQPVHLTDPQKAALLNIIKFWAKRAGGYENRPEGIYDLRNALHDDLASRWHRSVERLTSYSRAVA